MMEKFIPNDSEKAIMSCVDNYRRIKEEVCEAAVKSGRSENDVRLMAVTKTVEPLYINAVLDDGADLIGENRVQEYMGKRESLHLDNVEKHLICHLQSNKAKYIVGEVDVIESVDSLKIANAVSKECAKKGVEQSILVEINIGQEESKSGISLENAEELIEEIAQLPFINIKGLMTVPPICDDESKLMKYFDKMYQSFIDIKAKKLDNVSMDVLSMGMSNDFKTAILCGSNLVRVGSSIFGARKYY